MKDKKNKKRVTVTSPKSNISQEIGKSLWKYDSVALETAGAQANTQFKDVDFSRLQ
jgi:hypothetical protein